MLSVFIGGFRFILRDALLKNRSLNKKKSEAKENIVIYGAGTSGSKIASSLQTEDTANILFFVDDSPFLNGRTLDGIPIKYPNEIFKSKSRIDKILIAISSISLAKKNQIKSNLEPLKIPIFTIPSILILFQRNLQSNQIKVYLLKIY